MYPYTKRYLGTFDNHFSTIGLVGMNEAGLNARWLGQDMTDPATQKFTKEVLNHMRERLLRLPGAVSGDLYNLEATPAESTSLPAGQARQRNAGRISRRLEKRGIRLTIPTAPICRWISTEDIFAALDIQDELQTLYTSGTVFHAFLGEKLPDWKAAAALVRTIAENYKLPYYTLSPTYSVCQGSRLYCRESTLPVRPAENRRRSTAELLAITVRYRTGMMERPRSTKTESSMM